MPLRSSILDSRLTPWTTPSVSSPALRGQVSKPATEASTGCSSTGWGVEYRDSEGRIRGDQVQIVDFDNFANNDWLAVNQFTVTENRNNRRPDVVLFVNGLPLGIIELKSPTDEDATIATAWQQLQTYKAELPTLFSMNEALVVSDSNEARIGDTDRGSGVVSSPGAPLPARLWPTST